MYSDDAEFWHPLFVVKGREQIFGAHMFWASINRRTNAHIKRIGTSHGHWTLCGDLKPPSGHLLLSVHALRFSKYVAKSVKTYLTTSALLWHLWKHRCLPVLM